MQKLKIILALLLLFFAGYRRKKSWADAALDTIFAWYAPDELKVNGVRVSKAQLRLAEQLEVPPEHVNYKVGKRYVDIAFPQERLAVEYNGAIYHKSRAKDGQRARELIKLGWKVLIIQVESGFPELAWVKTQIKRLQSYKKRKLLYVIWR